MPSTKVKLTKRVIDGIKPEAKELFIWDTEIRGFGLRVWPSGRRVFIFQYRTKHKQTRRPVIGQFGSMTVEKARRTALQWASEVQDGGDPGGERRESRTASTVAELAERIPLGVVGQTDDIANAVLFLAGDGGRHITGATIDVNGGLYVR